MTEITDFYGAYTLPECGFTPPAGKKFDKWLVSGTSRIEPSGEKINVTNDCTLIAIWKDAPVEDRIVTVDLEIRSPEEGKAPSTAVTSGSSAYGVYSRDVRWGVSDDGINFRMMAAGEKFVGGKYYRVFMDVNLAGNHYKFAITTDGDTIQPDVFATVNGSPAVTEKAYDQDPEEVITVYFDFGKCNDYIIEEITIVNLTAPVAGQHPDYNVNVLGTGYHVDTTKNSYYDAYWVGEKWYYVKNGVSWWDVTDGGYDYVYENDVFLPGHVYRCEIHVCTEDGYEFVKDLYTDPETWPSATVNGKPGKLTFHSMVNDHLNQEVAYTFPETETGLDYMKGDFDKDGKITVADSLAALRIAARLAEETAEALEIGDIDADGKITVSDALAILRVAAKMSDSL